MSNLTIPKTWEFLPSPNKSKRTKKISAIVLHADASSRIESSLDWTRRAESKVSYHILIGRTGKVFMTVHPEDKAWHAGISTLDGVKNVNDFSIGVCLSNRNDGEAFPASQLQTGMDVCALLCRTYNIDPERITTHAIVSPGRKTDPKGLDLETFRLGVTERLLPPVK